MKSKHKATADKSVAKPKQKGTTTSSQPVTFKFLKFVVATENRKFLWIGLVVGVLYFIFLRILFPVPSFYSDSNTYIQAARDHYKISYRPIQYSEIINFFKGFSTSDFALIAGQYFSNLLANLLLFFTWIYFFPLKKLSKIVFFALLIVNPLYLFSSNYILTDAFFGSLTVTWFVMLIWTIQKPAWYYIIAQLLLLIILFKLRYNAIVFPLFMAIAIFYSPQALWKKLLSISVACVLIIMLIVNTINATEAFTGTRTFSPFSGWQLANNAMHVLRTEVIDSTKIVDEEQKEILNYMQNYFRQPPAPFDSVPVTAEYMWNSYSPLKSYLRQYQVKYNYGAYFNAWASLGPIYGQFGKSIILKKPVTYIQKFVVPNAKDYFFPPMEVYDSYNANQDTVAKHVVAFFKYSTNKVGEKHQGLYNLVFKPWKYLFAVLNILFLVLTATYFLLKKYKTSLPLFNKTLVCFAAFYLFNFFFVVSLAPTVFRYHLFIVTLSIPFILSLINVMIPGKKAVTPV